MLEVRDNIVNGVHRRAPLGILASGPPGTGKTFFFECWAYECGFNFLQMVNPRSKWVGESEEIAEKIFSAIDDLAPVMVVEDEADQSETGRDVPNGDSGVSNRLRQMKFMFTSDPKRRGKVIWVRISNRADLLDDAYKREGRSDDSIPFLMPEPSEYEDIFRVMFARYGVPTDITDFSAFARAVAEKIYCTGASVEWMVREADMYAGRDGKDKVEPAHLQQAIDDWEMKLNAAEVDRQTVLAIKGSSKRLRPDNWKTILAGAMERLQGRQAFPRESSVFPGVAGRAPIKQ
jgi:SpoVK/Ycf46/Vps4 family AAA+-type ATPase